MLAIRIGWVIIVNRISAINVEIFANSVEEVKR